MRVIDVNKINLLGVRKSSGFSLFELLIAILVLSVGLLGLATMQAQGLKSNNSAEKRTEATFLAMDIMERMRANMTSNPNLSLPPVVAAGFAGLDTNSVTPCPAGCAPVTQDLNQWTTAVQQQLGGGGNAWQARIEQVAVAGVGNVFRITLMWDDQLTGAAGTGCSGSAADMICFQTLFQP